MATAKILLYKHKTLKNGSHPIVIQIIKDRQRKIVSLGHSATALQWDSEKNKPTRKHPNFTHLNLLLQKKINQADKVIIDLDESDVPYSIDDIVAKLKANKVSGSVFDYTESLIKKLDRTGSIGNARVYENTLNVFKKFRKQVDLMFNQLNYKAVKEFEEYLLKEGRRTNTISVHLRTLRAIYNSAIRDGIAQESLYPFKNYAIKNEDTQKRAIRKEDIQKIRDLNLSGFQELKKARDLFLFSFNMRGMNLVDMAFLKVENIEEGRVIYSRKKTKQKFTVKLTDEALEIVRRYSDLKDPESFVFPIIRRKGKEYLDYRNALRLLNKKLKDIGEMAELSAPLTTYTARHSWGTVAKRMGHSIAKISEGYGHSTEQTTQIYLDSFEQEELDAMNEDITS